MSILRSLIAPQSQRSLGGYDMAILANGMQAALLGYGTSTLSGKVEDIDGTFEMLARRAYSGNGIVFAVMAVRMMLFTEARFGFQNMRGGLPGDFYGDRDRPNSGLALLDRPWPGGVTGDLLKYVITDADLAGNAFIAKRNRQLIRLRPDWTQIIHGTPSADGSLWDPDAELLGYSYRPGGYAGGREPVYFDASEVAHFAPIPDPTMKVRGMTWLRSVIPELMSDQAMNEMKLRYFENGATPAMKVKTTHTDLVKFREWISFWKQEHEGVQNAAKTLFMNEGVDAEVVGANLQQIDYAKVQGAGEVRIANAGGVPATVVGLSEGLQGSTLNTGNFASAMRRFADLTMSPLWRNLCGSLERIVPPPSGARLWYDTRGIPALKDDIKSAAEVLQMHGSTIGGLIKDGFSPESAVAAVTSGDLTRLDHTGLVSVQLQPPGTTEPPEPIAEPDQSPAEEEPA